MGALPGPETCARDRRGDNGLRHRAELEHRIVERADVEFRSGRFLSAADTAATTALAFLRGACEGLSDARKMDPQFDANE